MIELRITFKDDDQVMRIQTTILKTGDATEGENEYANWMEGAVRHLLGKVKEELAKEEPEAQG